MCQNILTAVVFVVNIAAGKCLDAGLGAEPVLSPFYYFNLASFTMISPEILTVCSQFIYLFGFP